MHLTRSLRRGFVTGVVLLAPLAVTVFVVQLVYDWLVSIVGPMLGVIPVIPNRFVRPVAVGLLLVVITAVGVAARHGAGDTLVRRFDRLVEAIPGVSVIYSSVREASTALTGHEDRFERVALVPVSGSGLRTLGFVTSTTPADLEGEVPDDARGETHYNVFVPMAPNPMGGFLVIVPESRITMTDLSVRDGIRIVVTTGMSGESAAETGEFPFPEVSTS